MIIYDGPGDLLQSRAQTLACTVNCVGAMGKGVALNLSNTFPGLLQSYRELCRTNQVQIGRVNVWKCHRTQRQILLLPTKIEWRWNSQYNWVYLGLEDLRNRWQELGITSMAMTPPGCGNGWLEYHFIQPALEYYLGDLPIPVEILHG